MNDTEKVMSAIRNLPIGMPIPKPESVDSSRVHAWGKRREEVALVYSMQNHSNPHKPHMKGVTVGEFESAYHRLVEAGEFTRKWFDEYLPECNKEGACNYTTIGGVFELVGVAKYNNRGRYAHNKLDFNDL